MLCFDFVYILEHFQTLTQPLNSNTKYENISTVPAPIKAADTIRKLCFEA